MTATPLAVISVPITDWETLSENERKLLSEYAASLIDDVKKIRLGTHQFLQTLQ